MVPSIYKYNNFAAVSSLSVLIVMIRILSTQLQCESSPWRMLHLTDNYSRRLYRLLIFPPEMRNYILFCFVKVMFWLYEIGILCKKFFFPVQLWAWRCVSILLIPKLLKMLFLEGFFNLILSALGDIMFHKGRIIIYRKLMHSFPVEVMD